MNKSDITKDKVLLDGKQKKKGFELFNHIFVGKNEETEVEKMFFISFLGLNSELNKEEIVISNKLNNEENEKKCKPSYFMVKAGCFGEETIQINNFFAWNNTDINYDVDKGFNIKLGKENDNNYQCICSEKELKGIVSVSQEVNKIHPEYMSDVGTIEWNLKLDKKITSNIENNCNGVFGKKEFYHAEGMKTLYNGFISIDGEKYDVIEKECLGIQDKMWGKKFPKSLITVQTNNCYSNITRENLKNTTVNVITNQDGLIITDAFYAGRNLEFVSKISKDNISLKEDEKYLIWDIKQESKKFIIHIKLCTHKENMIYINFEEPDGKLKSSLVTGNAFGEISLFRKEKSKDVIIDSLEVKNVVCRYDKIK